MQKYWKSLTYLVNIKGHLNLQNVQYQDRAREELCSDVEHLVGQQ